MRVKGLIIHVHYVSQINILKVAEDNLVMLLWTEFTWQICMTYQYKDACQSNACGPIAGPEMQIIIIFLFQPHNIEGLYFSMNHRQR